jgi:hypothetical protein
MYIKVLASGTDENKLKKHIFLPYCRHHKGSNQLVNSVTQRFGLGDWKLFFILAHNMPALTLGKFF